jgi:hypothetical protein
VADSNASWQRATHQPGKRIAGTVTKKKNFRPRNPCLHFFHRLSIEPSDRERRRTEKIVDYTMVLSDNYPIIGSFIDNVFSRLKWFHRTFAIIPGPEKT